MAEQERNLNACPVADENIDSETKADSSATENFTEEHFAEDGIDYDSGKARVDLTADYEGICEAESGDETSSLDYDTLSEATDENADGITDEVSTEKKTADKDADEEKNEGDEEYYRALADEDLRQLTSIFPELRGIKSITELPSALRYAELRDLGLSAKEAYLASGRITVKRDNRAHLHSAVPKTAADSGCSMKPSELKAARELFSSLSDRDIQSLYKKVTL